MNISISRKSSGPSNATMRRIQKTNLRLLVRQYILNQFNTYFLPRGTSGHKMIFNDPLNKRFSAQCCSVFDTRCRSYALSYGGCWTWGNTIDHRIGGARVSLYPSQKFRFALLFKELFKTFGKTVPIGAQIITVHQCDWPYTCSTTCIQQAR